MSSKARENLPGTDLIFTFENFTKKKIVNLFVEGLFGSNDDVTSRGGRAKAT